MFKLGELNLDALACRGPTRHHRSNNFLMAYGIGTYCASNFNVTANHSDNSVVFAQLAMEHPHILLLGTYVSSGISFT